MKNGILRPSSNLVLLRYISPRMNSTQVDLLKPLVNSMLLEFPETMQKIAGE